MRPNEVIKAMRTDGVNFQEMISTTLQQLEVTG